MEPQLAAEAAGTAQLPSLLSRGQRSRNPPTLHMVIEALRAQDQKKGVSVIAIKRFILAKYPSVDPIRLKYLLKQALSKGLSRGDLVRPPNSSATGATGRFKLPPKKLLQQKKLPSQADPDSEEALKPGQKGTTKHPQAAMAGARQRGAKEEKPTAPKRPKAAKKPKVKPVDSQPPAAAEPRSNGVKPPRAAARPRAPGKGHAGPPMAPAAKDAGGGHGSSPGAAGGNGLRKVPVGKSKGKASKGAQQGHPKAKGSQGKVGKARETPGAGQGGARQ